MKIKSDFILIGVLAGIVAVLDYIGVVGMPFGVFSVSSFYIGGAFFTAFALWFKKDGLLAIYIGLLLGAIISGTFTVFAFLLALGNVFGAMSIMLGFRFSKLNYRLQKPIDYLAFLGFVVISQLISSIWTLGGFVVFGLMPSEALLPAMTGWIIGGITVNIVIGIPLVKFFTPVISKSGLLKS
jgi:hypothetical protein